MRDWYVDIPEPTAARLEPRLFRIDTVCTFNDIGRYRAAIDIPPGVRRFVFEGPDEWEDDGPDVLDGYTTLFFVDYSNDSGSRTETIAVTPSPVPSR